MDAREQACWSALVFESKLSVRTLNALLVYWCEQLGRTVEEFLAADAEAWRSTCGLQEDFVQRLEQVKVKLATHVLLVEQLQQAGISIVTMLDEHYPQALKQTPDHARIPPILFYAGDLDILQRRTIAIIGSRNAQETSLRFTRTVAQVLADDGANVINGYARGIYRASYEGAVVTGGHATIVLPHGVRKLNKVQLQDLQPRIAAGQVLLLSQFHPYASWMVSRAMERNRVITSLAQVVIIAESEAKGGTWEAANAALKQKRLLFVRQTEGEEMPAGNELLLAQGGQALRWPPTNIEETIASLLGTAQALS